jgi:ribosomal protein L25 (general stress protein Ctc)
MDVTGDLVTEDLGRILASVCGGKIEPIQQLIENRQANEYVRSSALQSLIILVVQGKIEREVIIKYFEQLFSTRLKREDSYIWTNLVMESALLAPLQLKQQIDYLR